MQIHFIAVGGAVMHNLAITLRRKGHIVSGSDDDIFEPSRSRLASEGLLPEKMGWDANRITNDLDAIILGMHARKDNPELLKAQEIGVPVYSFPEYIYKESENKQRIAIAGSHGKTTTTAMIMHVCGQLNKKFDFMAGAQLDGFDLMVELSETAPFILLEADEYLSSPLDLRSKFLHYKPHTSMITGIAWDHINVFPTYDSYLQTFRDFIQGMDSGSRVVYFEDDSDLNEIAISFDHVTLVPYSTPAYRVEQGQYIIEYGGKDYPMEVIGKHNMQNMEGARLVCEDLDIKGDVFWEAIGSFNGAARRLEVVEDNDRFSVYRDFAHAPSKVEASVKAIKEQYPDRKLYACLELHTYSSLNREFLPHYKDTMSAGDERTVFVNAHTFEIKKMEPLTKEEIRTAFGDHDLQVILDGEEFHNYLNNIDVEGASILLMSSGDFNGLRKEDLAKFVAQA